MNNFQGAEATLREALSNFIRTKYIRRGAFISVMFLTILILYILINSKINVSRKPDVILIVCDTLRADHLGCYGYGRDTSKNIDLLAEEAFIFKNAYAQAPSTTPSMWNILTSRYQSEIHARDEYVTIAEYFKSRHYNTAAFIAQAKLRKKKSNLHQGFDLYDAKCREDRYGRTTRRAESVTMQAIEWIRQIKNQPFFVWLVYYDPHGPYSPPDRFKGYYNKTKNFDGDRAKTRPIDSNVAENLLASEEYKQLLINAYDEEIRYFDYAVGKLFEYLKSSGKYENSIIILTADHGEELGDNGNRWDHCQLLSQEEIWIPLLIKMPGQRKKITREETVQQIDIYPTVVEYLGKPFLSSFYKTLEGKSLMPLLNSNRLCESRFAASFWEGQRCIIMGDYKYWMRDGQAHLTNIRTQEKITDSKKQYRLKNLLEQICKQYDLEDVYYDKTLKDLRSLGYLQ